MKKKTARILGIITLMLGILLFVFIAVVSLWGDIEATFFDASLIQADRIKHLQCPPVITTNEISKVTAEITNTDRKPVTIEVRAHVTNGFVTLMNEYITDVPLEPGETKPVDVPIAPANAAYDRLILVRVHQMKELSNPYQNASCGVVLVNVPFLTGRQFVMLVMSLGVLLTAGGFGLWAFNSRPIILQRKRTFISLLIFAAIAILLATISLIGIWILGVIVAAVWLLMGISLIWQFFLTPNKDESGMGSIN
jgi:hypothetical protein